MTAKALTIGRLSKAASVSADTLRYYERESLLKPARKSEAGYRLYGADALMRLAFIRHAQECGFSLSEIRQLLSLRARSAARCGEIKKLAVEKKLQLAAKMKAMQTMARALII